MGNVGQIKDYIVLEFTNINAVYKDKRHIFDE